MPLHATSCHFMPLHATSCHFMPLHATSSGVKWREMACRTVSMPLHATSCHFKWREVAWSGEIGLRTSCVLNANSFKMVQHCDVQNTFKIYKLIYWNLGHLYEFLLRSTRQKKKLTNVPAASVAELESSASKVHDVVPDKSWRVICHVRDWIVCKWFSNIYWKVLQN